ncbi:MAG: LysE family translocator [Desulfobacteraceae bacterium]|nr:LysE family translocator [Desulfobacteraceae bacterium]
MVLNNLLLFSSIAFIAAMTPGPTILLVSANSLNYGVKKSIFTILGNISGLFLMSLLAVLGLSTVILYSAPVFFCVKIIGALYLIYLGIRLWRNGFGVSKMPAGTENKLKETPQTYKFYLQGVFVSLSNPKAIAFTTALFPQFIKSELPLAPQFLTLVIIIMFISFSCLLGYAVLAAKAKLRSNGKGMPKIAGKLFGSAFIGSGVALMITTQK